MGSKQGGETRKMNDFLRALEDDTFNLGLENTMVQLEFDIDFDDDEE